MLKLNLIGSGLKSKFGENPYFVSHEESNEIHSSSSAPVSCPAPTRERAGSGHETSSALTAAMATADARKPVVIFRSEKGPDDPYAKVGKIESRAGDSLARQASARD